MLIVLKCSSHSISEYQEAMGMLEVNLGNMIIFLPNLMMDVLEPNLGVGRNEQLFYLYPSHTLSSVKPNFYPPYHRERKQIPD